MKILVLYRHFWPDSPPYATKLRSIGRRLVADGHEMTVWCEAPSYKKSDLALDAPRLETLDGIRVERMSRLPLVHGSRLMRTLGKLLFVPRLLAKAVVRKLRGQRYDLVWTATIPPVLQGWAGRTIARLFGARFLYHCQDLYPELATYMGMWPRNGMLYRILSPIERRTRQRATALVTLSSDMANTAAALAPGARIEVINNFMLDVFSEGGEPVPQQRPRPSGGRITIGFAGNIGQFQALDAVVDAYCRLPAETPLELEFMGDGEAKPSLVRQAQGRSSIRFLPHRPFAEARQLIAAYDLGLVSVEPNIYRVAYPSKTLTYLGLGVPVLAIIEPESELARMIEDEGIGFAVGQRDSTGIASRLAEIAASADSLAAMRTRALAYYEEVMSTEARLNQWAALIKELEQQ
jgi:glycosyltransferase involved in cell wall biosynthesis